MRRVWTLQEGLLARELYFEFVEGPVNVAAALGFEPTIHEHDGRSSPKDPLAHLFPKFCASHVPILAYRARHQGAMTGGGSKLSLDDVIRLLRLRRTTKPEDELIAISSLLPLNLRALLSITGHDVQQRRMKDFLLQMREVSKTFPMQITPKLNLPGYTWAPRTLVEAIEGAPVASGVARCMDDGLHAEYFIVPFEKRVCIPESCVDGTETEFRRLLTHGPSASTYMLRIYIALGHLRLPGIDALLFCDRDLTGARTCAAVCNGLGGGKEVEGGLSSEDTPGSASTHFDYVAPCRLHRMTLRPDNFPATDASLIGELRDVQVRLT